MVVISANKILVEYRTPEDRTMLNIRTWKIKGFLLISYSGKIIASIVCFRATYGVSGSSKYHHDSDRIKQELGLSKLEMEVDNPTGDMRVATRLEI